MTRMHIHVGVEDVAKSTAFYTTLFGQAPSFTRDDYAKWFLEDPAVNFVISTHCGGKVGVDHVGLESDSAAGLGEIAARLKSAGEATFDEPDAHCCYANSQKTWVTDPGGLRWETFHTRGQTTDYGEDAARDAFDGKNKKEAKARPACCA
ncbi:MAG: ArsI/CadI family heavy metal resistance metalloenzyme [Pseudomonadota bacterium]